ncbi:hypothetical protein U8335_13590 [Roseiconus lacunae]|uniref:hypothetical protein n=1 Tax=Roseiconus lacunae TaxID=2605694 RepID=UPI0030922B05|nr:hypothetical protein U8335_13590 [Stieleria sp. HD01]
MPATFTSFDLGTFGNGLSTISVEANEEGVASANFVASGGVGTLVNLLAASPVAAERVEFRVRVLASEEGVQ